MNKNERSRIESDLLQTFLIVAEARNLTRAADGLGRTQSAISVQIRKLEDALSVKLFHREARGMTLTEAGETLLPAAKRALSEIDRIGDLFAKPLLGRVRVGIPEDYGTGVLEKVLATFAARHPAVEVIVRCGFSGRFPNAIERGELDLAVHAADPLDRVGTVLLTERTIWVAHPELKLDPAEPAPLALFDRDCWWRDSAIKALERIGRPYRIAYTSESISGVKAAISAGLAVGVLAESTVEPPMRVLRESDHFPALPPSALILRRREAVTEASLAMEAAIRSAFGTA
ncbi:hypothetical protein N825_13775 [Skermanella stibiiresistens SB22]|uniref:HTH lysR-type domain-containing protein n=1 Tax=Skermanella stibiiresistens SB22 TaxID=1385369 RepID=W9H0N7_9PROT|nr:LysR substrate-binding domain-containing protein [Skermanella stibiiresistens]EWY38272.1 hypothetical protein N825_13775 [Skermanella stibiiresistens SB22]